MPISLVLMCTECSVNGGMIPLGEVSSVRNVTIPESVPIGAGRQPSIRIDACKHVPGRGYSFSFREADK